MSRRDLFEPTPDAFVACDKIIAAGFVCTLIAIWLGWLA